MPSSNVAIEVTYRVTGKYHESGYCSDPSEIINIDSYTTTIKKSPPSKEFIEKNFNDDGNLNSDYEYDISNLDFTDNCIHGSGHCGCGKNYTAINAKLVILDTSIKSKFLAEMSYEPTPKTIPKVYPSKSTSAKPIRTDRSEYCKKPPNTYKRCHSCGDVGHISKSCPKNRAPRNGKRNMFMSPSYIERCKIIKCKYGPNCTRRYSSTNPCYYNHNFKQ